MSRLNPELRRYLWLELTVNRLVTMPLVIAAVMLLVGAWAYEPGRPFGGAALLGAMAGLGVAGFAALVLFWGARLAANAVVREVSDRTWDQQRLSSAGAWAMTWGKLAGSTVFVWYGCVLLELVAIVSLVLLEAQYGGVTADFGVPLWVVLVQLVVGSAAFAVLVMAAVMLSAMTTVARRESGRQLDVSLAQFAIIVVALLVTSSFGDLEHGDTLTWFGATFDVVWFFVASLVVFSAWSVIGLWRRMRVELQVRNWPVMWPLFVLFGGAWCAGFAPGMVEAVVVMTLVVLLAGYAPAVLEQLDPVRLRRLFSAMKARDAATALRFMPLWLVNHLLALVLVLIAVVILLGQGGRSEGLMADIDGHAIAAGTLVAFFLFVTRDLLLLVFAWLGGAGRRAFAAWLLWMAVLYGLVPLILAAVGAYASLPAFVPVWDVPFADLVVSPVVWPLLQVVVALVLVRWRWRRYAASALAGAG